MSCKELPIKKSERIIAVDMLRGIAAFIVCIFHFTNGNKNYLPKDYWLRDIGSYGWTGVEIFFVISGFVIPWSLYQSRYSYKNWSSFLVKRIARIEPPYFVTIILILLLNHLSTLSPYFKGQNSSIDYFNLALHIGYLNAFFEQPWLNPVFWTLAIEFQFYLLMACCFPLFTHSSNWVKILITLAFLPSCLLSNSHSLIFHYSAYFVIGLIIFYRYTGTFNKKILDIVCLVLLATIYFKYGAAPLFASTFAWMMLVYFKKMRSKSILFLGTISYSLYLIHIPIGGRMINLSMNFIKSVDHRSLFIVLVLVVNIIAAYIFYRLIELPSFSLAKKIGKKKISKSISNNLHA